MLNRPHRIVTLLVLSLCVGGASLVAAAAEADSRKPNVIICFTDDQGTLDVNCYGSSDLYTPHMDRLAAEGVRFTQAYAACGVCSPSRSAILTGRTPYRNGVFRWIPSGSEVHLRTSRHRATDEYRTEMIRALLPRTLAKAAERARASQPVPVESGLVD